ncbi:PaaI family thioesterase [Derxia gummosa]|uniref:PaaI family thioesterase n=1 Tax=Derxia gummosa DSM 723 TaxID=1121388 RepID=A0A8B6XBN4_9BURK|nr:PaaI family thioesterase [Derxia gummosa]
MLPPEAFLPTQRRPARPPIPSTMTATLDPRLEAKIRTAYAAQGPARLLGLNIVSLAPGRCSMELPFSEAVSQHHGYYHGGIISTLGDSVGGAAGCTRAGIDDGIVAVEFKINFLAPAVGEKLVGHAEVVRAGRQLVITTIDIVSVKDGVEKQVALMQQTLAVLAGMEPAAQWGV